MSGEMLASAEDHSTVTVAPALEGFCRGRTITFVDPSAGDVGEVVDWEGVEVRRHRGGGRGGDDGGHGCLVLVGVQGGLNLHLPLCRTTRDPPLKGAWLRHRKLACKTRRSLNVRIHFAGSRSFSLTNHEFPFMEQSIRRFPQWFPFPRVGHHRVRAQVPSPMICFSCRDCHVQRSGVAETAFNIPRRNIIVYEPANHF